MGRSVAPDLFFFLIFAWLYVDQLPLVSILNNKLLCKTGNPRLQRMREKLLTYNFTVPLADSKSHYTPDSPVLLFGILQRGECRTEDEDYLLVDITSTLSIICKMGTRLAHSLDQMLLKVRYAAVQNV